LNYAVDAEFAGTGAANDLIRALKRVPFVLKNISAVKIIVEAKKVFGELSRIFTRNFLKRRSFLCTVRDAVINKIPTKFASARNAAWK
jgi:hypothetical protein